ncbi:MAG TPA: hypothetical protein GXX74_00260 [Clostridiales bacterium]|nr:hypothetical protein [Clostridiales bacterium]
MPKEKKTTSSGKLIVVQSVRRTRSRRMKFCVHGGLGDTLNKQRLESNGYPGALLAPFYPEMKGASEETVKFHSPAQFVSNFSDSSVSSFAVSCVWCKRVSRISDGQLQ